MLDEVADGGQSPARGTRPAVGVAAFEPRPVLLIVQVVDGDELFLDVAEDADQEFVKVDVQCH